MKSRPRVVAGSGGSIQAGAQACANFNDCVSGDYFYGAIANDQAGEGGFVVDLTQSLDNLIPGQTCTVSMSMKGVGIQYAVYDSQTIFDHFGTVDWQPRTGTFVASNNPLDDVLQITIGAEEGMSVDVQVDNVVVTGP